MKRTFAIIAGLISGSLAPRLEAQHPVVYQVAETHFSDHFGTSLAVLNDIDGDGVPDFVAGATQDFINPETNLGGYIHLISGKTGKILRTWHGAVSPESIGRFIVPMGDLDKDGNVDFAAIGDLDLLTIFSPVKEKALSRFPVGLDRYTSITALAAADLDGDGISDVIVGEQAYYLNEEPYLDAGGRVSCYSAIDSRALWHSFGKVDTGLFGSSIAVIGDVDGDRLPDLAVGEPMGNFGLEDYTLGQVRIIRGIDGVILRTISNQVGYQFGYELSNVGDLDGDGFPELLIAAPGYKSNRGRDQGWVGVYSTRTFELLRSFKGLEGVLTLEFKGDALGYKLGSAGDVDLDGTPDILITAYRIGAGIGPDYGRLDLRSGRTGALLASYEERQWDDPWIGALSPLGDIDGDGRPEFLVGSPNLPTGSESTHNFEAGRVLALRYEPDEPRFVRGDVNGDGRVNLADAIAILRKGFFQEETGGCLRAFDVNGDGKIQIYDFIQLISFQFYGGFSPSPPFPECGRFGGLRESPLDCRSSPCMAGPRSSG